jgi:hypothetical protein
VRIFTAAEELAVLRGSRLRDWAASKLITPEQKLAAAAKLGPTRKTAGLPIRLLFGFFTMVLLGGVFGVGALIFHGGFAGGVLAFLTAAAAYAAGKHLIASTDHYRFGVEEALLLGALMFGAGGCLGVLNGLGNRLDAAAASLALVAGGAWLYARFGYLVGLLAAAAGVVCLGVTFDLGETALRLYLTVLFGGAFAASWAWEPSEPDRAGWEFFQAALFMMTALTLNLRLEAAVEITSAPRPPDASLFYWATLLACGLLPPLALWLGVERRHRALLWAGAITAAVWLATLKPYLGWARHTWDPAVFGVFLAAAAYWLQRALAAEPGGWTAAELVVARGSGLELGSMAAAMTGAGGPAPRGDSGSGFGGGSSGGGGATDAF